ncbi:hypothetical protein BC629DRAFT_1075830 [Irpex lacteus]|nr:hypothetical protein BC629DRAFT_1075830 [Irpex lacteus]
MCIQADSLGMDSHSVDVPLADGSSKKKRRIDVPMRSFQGGYYPQLIALYQHLGVHFRIADFSYSFAHLSPSSSSSPSSLTTSSPSSLENCDSTQRRITTFMIYDGASGRKGISVPSRYFPSGKSSGIWEKLVGYAAYALGAFVLVFFALKMALHSLPLRSSGHSSSPSNFVSITTTFHGLLNTPLKIRIPRRILPLPIRPPPHTTFRQWVRATTPRGTLARAMGLDRRWVGFAEDVLVPLFSAVCTAEEEAVWEHPVEEFLDFCYLTIGTHHYVVQNGVRDVVERISAPLKKENIHLASPIVSLVYNSSPSPPSPPASPSSSSPSPSEAPPQAKIDIHCTNNTVYPSFDHVIFATQANQAASILKSYLDTIPDTPTTTTSKLQPNDHLTHEHKGLVEQQIKCLETFEYATNVVVNHTDASVMPDSYQDRRDLNLMMACPSLRTTPPTPTPTLNTEGRNMNVVPPTFAMATHVLPGADGVYQTTNPVVPIEEGKVLSVTRLERAVVSVGSKEALAGLWVEYLPLPSSSSHAQEKDDSEAGTLQWGCAAVARGKLGRLQGAGGGPGVWLCGSYACGGIPLLEGCVVSARLVVEEGVWASEGVDWREVGELWAPSD